MTNNIVISIIFCILFFLLWLWVKESQANKPNKYLTILLLLLPFASIAQSEFSFNCFLKMESYDQIANTQIDIKIDSQYIKIATADTVIRHRIISERYNPYAYQMEYILSCGGKMRIDLLWDKTIKSFFFKCPGTHWYSARNFEEAVANNEYE